MAALFKPSSSLRSLLVLPTGLALLACILLFCCISSTSRLMINLHKNPDSMNQTSLPNPTTSSVLESHLSNVSAVGDQGAMDDYDLMERTHPQSVEEVSTTSIVEHNDEVPDSLVDDNRREEAESELPEENPAAPIVEVDDKAIDALDNTREESEDTQNQLPEERIVVENDAEADDASDSRTEGTENSNIAVEVDDASDPGSQGIEKQLQEESPTASIVEHDDEVPDTLVDDNRREEAESQLPEENPAAPIAIDALDNTREESEDTQNQLPEERLVVENNAEADDASDSRREETEISNIAVEVEDEAHDSSDVPGSQGTEKQLREESQPAPIEEVVEEADGGLENKSEETQSKSLEESSASPVGDSVNSDNDAYHDKDLFFENYKAMNGSLKIYVYPHNPKDRFANVLQAMSNEPGGNYASEGYLKKALMKSHFITKDPSKADFFFLPFSITAMRNDKRIGVRGMQDYVRDYVSDIRRNYPYWNRTGGADHFYAVCHSIGKIAMGKAPEVHDKAIQVVCSSNYFVNGYVAHKDVSMPQIWPRQGHPPRVEPSKRKRLAFFAGASNAPTRKYLVNTWQNDSEIFAHAGRLKTPYGEEFLRSKFCFHVKGYEVNTARIGDAMFYGCVPVIVADHYDLPFGDILNWKSFSVVVETRDVPLMKNILKGIGNEEYLRLYKNVAKVREHFQWHGKPIEYDCFHMVMYELWLRRNYVRVPLS